MTLIQLSSGRKLLIDINIRESENSTEDVPDVAHMLRDKLNRDGEGRLYVDAFLLSHPDEDHCRGLRSHFHLGDVSDWSEREDKILINEIWSSPIVFRRASRDHKLCPDAEAFNVEASRRVNSYRQRGCIGSPGDRIQILGEDENGETDEFEEILVKVDDTLSKIDAAEDGSFSAVLLAPLPAAESEDKAGLLSKNDSSTILNFSFEAQRAGAETKFLTGGDAAVAIWEELSTPVQTLTEASVWI